MNNIRRLFFVLFVVAVPLVSATTKNDSILAVTDGVRARMSWVRWPWADSNYTPIKTPYIDMGQVYENNHQTTQLMGYDTDKGKAIFIDSVLGYHCFPRITRKTGNYVIWNDPGNKCSWIRDIACTAPKRKFIDGGDFWVLACQYNPVTDSEFVYIFQGWNKTSNYFAVLAGLGVVQVPLKSDYTPDLTKTRTIITTTGQGIMHTVNLSQDGKYMGCNVPLPNTIILETATAKQIARHDPSCEYGCHTNIAPDNSYRFFHLTDAHVEVAMYDPGVAASAPMRHVNIMSSMPGNSGVNNAMDPRWSNDVRYFSNSYPLENGIRGPDLTADQLKAADASRAGSFCLAKFNAGFTAVEKAVRITDGDVRHREGVGDAWIGAGIPQSIKEVSPSQKVQSLSLKNDRIGFTSSATVRLTNALGRSILNVNVQNGSQLNLKKFSKGICIVSVRSNQNITLHKTVVSQ